MPTRAQRPLDIKRRPRFSEAREIIERFCSWTVQGAEDEGNVVLRDGSDGEGVVAEVVDGWRACVCGCAFRWDLEVYVLAWNGCETMDLGLWDWDCEFDEFGVGDLCDGCESGDGIEFPTDDIEDEESQCFDYVDAEWFCVEEEEGHESYSDDEMADEECSVVPSAYDFKTRSGEKSEHCEA